MTATAPACTTCARGAYSGSGAGSLGEDLILWGTHFFLKEAGDARRVSWHQDASYWPLSPSKTVTVWLAIDDADAGNGAMRVIPRSHVKAQLAYRRSTEAEHNVLAQTLAAEEQGDPAVTIGCAPARCRCTPTG